MLQLNLKAKMVQVYVNWTQFLLFLSCLILLWLAMWLIDLISEHMGLFEKDVEDLVNAVRRNLDI